MDSPYWLALAMSICQSLGALSMGPWMMKLNGEMERNGALAWTQHPIIAKAHSMVAGSDDSTELISDTGQWSMNQNTVGRQVAQWTDGWWE